MDQDQQAMGAPAVQVSEPIDIEALIALVEARVVENLAQMIERLAQQKTDGS